MIKLKWLLMATTLLWLGHAMADAHEPRVIADELGLSPDVRALLQAEMREIAGASQAIVILMVSGDWAAIARMSEQIRDSYVMKQNLTDAQELELEEKLPRRFKSLDGEFHSRAERLRFAAASRDSEMIAFHYYRLLETCAACHAEYARSRFPGFSPDAPEHHAH